MRGRIEDAAVHRKSSPRTAPSRTRFLSGKTGHRPQECGHVRSFGPLCPGHRGLICCMSAPRRFRMKPGAQAPPARRAARRSAPPARSGHGLRCTRGRRRLCSPPTSRGERLIPRMVLRADLRSRDPTGRRWRRGDRFSDRGNRFGRSVCRTAVRLADVDRRIVDLRTDASGGTGRVYTASGDGRMPAPCEPYSCWSSNSSECSPGRRRRARR